MYLSGFFFLALQKPVCVGGGGGGRGGIKPPPYFPYTSPKLTKLGTIVDCDKLYFILVVKVLNWLWRHNDVIFSILIYQLLRLLAFSFFFKKCS